MTDCISRSARIEDIGADIGRVLFARSIAGWSAYEKELPFCGKTACPNCRPNFSANPALGE